MSFLGVALRLAPLLLLVTSCGPDETNQRRGKGDLPDENFLDADTIRVTSPSNGETVESPVTLAYETGSAVDRFFVKGNGATLTIEEVASEDGTGLIVLDLESGRWDFNLEAYDAENNPLSEYAFAIRVAGDEESWVTITSPSDGSEVPNPVIFTTEASDDIALVQILADGWEVASGTPGDLLTTEFSGTGYPRDIEALAFDDFGEEVASDSIEITVTPPDDPDESDFNDTYLAYADSYPTDGTNGYYWPADDGTWFGTTRDIYYMDELWSPGDPEGRCYCVGLTIEVFMRTFQELDLESGGDGSLNGIDRSEFTEFVRDWFVRDLWGKGIVDAMENYGIGDEVTTWSEVKRGDIVQFWRHNGSGHNVVFLDWERDSDDEIIGMQYWSTQSGTDGIGAQSEYFGSSGSDIHPSYFFVGRVRMPVDWEPWY